MILTKEVKIRITPYNINYYLNLGYQLIYNQNLIVPIRLLQDKSNAKVLVVCDICKKEKTIKYCNYIKNLNNWAIYCCCSKCCQIKVKKTNLKKYGVEYVFQDKEFKENSKRTLLEKYGVENIIQNKEIQLKVKSKLLELYGVENAMQSEEVRNKNKKTCFEKYGVEYVFQDKEFKENSKRTLLEKYGVENVIQNKEIHEKQQMSGFKAKIHEDTKILYRGTYEKSFLDFCFLNKISVENGKTIKYFFDGRKRVYFSDFYLESKNLIIEIKSSYTYKRYLNKNLAKQKACLDQGYNFIFIIDKNNMLFLNKITT